jgi:putative ribosome biogenesis GTPase RsgA
MGKTKPELPEHKPPGRFLRLLMRIFKKRSQVALPAAARTLALSIQPNPSYFVQVPTSPFRQLTELIELSDGGVFAVTGVRGAGKSVLLNALAGHSQNRFHTLSLAAPIGSSHEMDGNAR